MSFWSQFFGKTASRRIKFERNYTQFQFTEQLEKKKEIILRRVCKFVFFFFNNDSKGETIENLEKKEKNITKNLQPRSELQTGQVLVEEEKFYITNLKWKKKNNGLYGFFEEWGRHLRVFAGEKKVVYFTELAGNFSVQRVSECKNSHFTSMPTTNHSASMSYSLLLKINGLRP